MTTRNMPELDQDTAVRVRETALIIDSSLKRLLTDVIEKSALRPLEQQFYSERIALSRDYIADSLLHPTIERIPELASSAGLSVENEQPDITVVDSSLSEDGLFQERSIAISVSEALLAISAIADNSLSRTLPQLTASESEAYRYTVSSILVDCVTLLNQIWRTHPDLVPSDMRDSLEL